MKKNFFIFIIASAIILIIFQNVKVTSVDEYYLTHPEEISSNTESVTLSVECSKVFDRYDDLKQSVKQSDILPSDGVILAKTEYAIGSGDTVFDVLSRALQYNKVHFDYGGSADSPMNAVYIKGINNLYEYDCGDLSGWMYSVNGEYSQVACSEYVLSDGDVVCWSYTCDLGVDLGRVYDDFD